MALLDHAVVDRFSGTALAKAGATALPFYHKLYTNGGKRTLDFIVVLVTLPFWLPVILMVAGVVSLDGRNPFFTQARVGRHGRVFRIIKLRSMVPDAEAVLASYLRDNPAARAEWHIMQKLKFDPRITQTGRFIRRTSIDELPQLFNVLLGDMSLVGPRPMMVSQQPLYSSRSYYEMRPGITGFWQISSRNHCHFAGRARYDNAYFKAMSLSTDLTVLWRTISVVLRGTGC